MIVVETFSCCEECKPLQVSCPVRVGTATEVVADGVDCCGSTNVEIRVHDCCNRCRPRTQCDDEDCEAEEQPEIQPRVDPSVPAVGLEIAGIPGDRCLVSGFRSIQKKIRTLNLPPSEKYRRMGVALDVGESVVLAVDRYPLAGADPCREPDDRAKNMAGWSTQRQSTVGERSMQIDGCGEVRQERHDDSSKDAREHCSHDWTVTRRRRFEPGFSDPGRVCQ